MAKTSLANRATRALYRKGIDANWHSGTVSTVNSTVFQIRSDLITATYDFLLYGETANLVQALSIAKHSKHKVLSRLLTADEFTEVTRFKFLLKVGMKFTDDKEHVEFILYVKDSFGKARQVNTLSKLTQERLKQYTNALKKIEEIYETL